MSIKSVTEEFNEATVRELICIGLKTRDPSVNHVTRIERKRDKHGDRCWEQWRPIGVSGYEWEFDMEPTHWMPLNIELPEVSSEDSSR